MANYIQICNNIFMYHTSITHLFHHLLVTYQILQHYKIIPLDEKSSRM